MKGKLLIIDSIRHYGKILLDDVRESAVMTFPATYDSGDKIDVKFISDDPSKEIISMSAEADDIYYGSLLLPSKDGRVYRSIITTYPTLIGLVGYSPDTLNFTPSQETQYVKFHIRKDITGKLLAFDIKKVGKNESYRSTSPVFGRISEHTMAISEGYVKHVVKERAIPADYAEGVISELRVKNQGLENEFAYGFIKDNTSGNRVYFTSENYQRFYREQPSTGDQARFIISRSENGFRVNRFCSEHPKGVLPQDQQYCIIKSGDRDYNIPLTEYQKFYKKEPSVGDVINCINSKHSIELIADSQTSLKRHRLIIEKPRSKDIQTGFIDSYISEKGYGFIRLDANNSTAFFHYSNYQDNLGHLPIAGTRVIVSVRVDEKNGKLRIHKFFSPVEFDCGEAQFNDFGSPSTDELYVAYIDSDNQVKEISRANLEQLPLAVAYYKSTDRDKHHLLQAIETMIQHRFNDQKISPNKLIDDRFRLLNELVRESVENNLPFQLSEYQYRLQVLKYEPQKLTSCTNGEKGSFIMLSDVTVPEMNTQETGWEFINHDSEITEAETVKGWDIDHDDNSEGVGDVITHLKWDIDMRELGNILNFDRTQAYYNIEL